MPDSCFQYFLLPCYCIPPSVLVTPFLIFDTGTTPTSLTSAAFPAVSFLTRLHLNLSVLTLSYFPSLHAVFSSSSPLNLLTSICSLLILLFFFPFYVEYVCDHLPCATSHSLVSIVLRLQCFNSLCCSSLTTEAEGVSAMPPPYSHTSTDL